MTFGRDNVAAALRFSVPALSVVLLVGIGYSSSVNANDGASDGPPTVTIKAPRNKSTYKWDTLVNYSIVVSYQGKSTQYQEIPSNQVLLTATYAPDLSAEVGEPAASVAGPTPAGLLDIIRSNCLGCHEFKAKAMGPSFAAIAERYPQNQATVSTLSRSIRSGSTGVWGQGSMPPHQELTDDQVHAIVLWLTKDAANPNVRYYVGTEGAIRMDAPGKPDLKSRRNSYGELYQPSPCRGSEPSSAWRRHCDRPRQLRERSSR